jgi:hypothetical protein
VPRAKRPAARLDVVRPMGLAFVVALVLAGCGSGSGVHEDASISPKSSPGTLGAILARPGPDIALTPGTSDYAVGPVRVSFLVIDKQGRAVSRPRARVWLGRSLADAPLVRTQATLEAVGVPGKANEDPLDVTHLFVTRFNVPRPGKYVLVAEPVGGRPIQGALDVEVKSRPFAPPVGAKAIPSRTPTLATAGGNLAALTTATPPDRDLLRYSVADSLAAHKPFVLVFATPAFCRSRTCGPVVDVVQAVRKRLAGTGIRFIHVEIYKDNDPSAGPNRWVREWRLPSEPFIFLVGRNGRIKARFEGSVSVAELTAGVKRTLGARAVAMR